MEFASDAAAFLVLQGHQVSGEAAQGLFGLLKKLGLLYEGLVGSAAVGDIFDGEEDQGLLGIEAAGIENHDAFAEVLKIVAERLVLGTRSRHLGDERTAARGRDMVARLGGDEFGIICGPPALSQPEADAFAARLPRIVQSPIAIGAMTLFMTLGWQAFGGWGMFAIATAYAAAQEAAIEPSSPAR